jgi:hypothetical protein
VKQPAVSRTACAFHVKHIERGLTPVDAGREVVSRETGAAPAVPVDGASSAFLRLAAAREIDTLVCDIPQHLPHRTEMVGGVRRYREGAGERDLVPIAGLADLLNE